MQDEMSAQDLKDRLGLIESMIAEGRRSAESWGWTYLLWGVALYVAMGWAAWTGSDLAWPVTMVAAFVITVAIGFSKGKGHPRTTLGRAAASIWVTVGITMLMLFPALGISGRLDPHTFVAVVAGMLGMANGASGLLLKWKAQMACAAAWWATSVAGCFSTGKELNALLLAAIFICQIVFGVYAMILESRRRPGGVVHA